jgi:hypothetical protein
MLGIQMIWIFTRTFLIGETNERDQSDICCGLATQSPGNKAEHKRQRLKLANNHLIDGKSI